MRKELIEGIKKELCKEGYNLVSVSCDLQGQTIHIDAINLKDIRIDSLDALVVIEPSAEGVASYFTRNCNNRLLSKKELQFYTFLTLNGLDLGNENFITWTKNGVVELTRDQSYGVIIDDCKIDVDLWCSMITLEDGAMALTILADGEVGMTYKDEEEEVIYTYDSIIDTEINEHDMYPEEEFGFDVNIEIEQLEEIAKELLNKINKLKGLA